jgi:hypothetical protein
VFVLCDKVNAGVGYTARVVRARFLGCTRCVVAVSAGYEGYDNAGARAA